MGPVNHPGCCNEAVRLLRDVFGSPYVGGDRQVNGKTSRLADIAGKVCWSCDDRDRTSLAFRIGFRVPSRKGVDPGGTFHHRPPPGRQGGMPSFFTRVQKSPHVTGEWKRSGETEE